MNIKEVLEKELYSRSIEITGEPGESTKTAISVTGEEYIEYRCVFHELYDICAWFDYLLDFKFKAVNSSGIAKIYWRVKPSIMDDPIPDRMYRLRMRFLVSNKQKVKQ